MFKVAYTVKPLYNEHHWGFEKCSLYRNVHYIEVPYDFIEKYLLNQSTGIDIV